MELSRKNLNRYRKALDEVTRLAKRDLQAAYKILTSKGLPPEMVRDGLIEAVYGITGRYGDMAATASAQWYEEIRPPGTFRPSLGDTAPIDQVEGAVRAAVQHLWSPNPDQTLTALMGPVQRMIEDAARDTIIKNAGLDPLEPSWARVPSGTKTCAFCTTLASKGFGYTTAEAAAKQSHNDCRCLIVPSFEKHPKVEGYDPERYKHMYDYCQMRSADGTVDMKATQALMRRVFPDDLKDGVHTWGQSEWDKVWNGKIVVNSRGIASLNGGHRSGKGWSGKTEFPVKWTEAEMKQASLLAWWRPDAVMLSGDRRFARKVVNDVLVEVQGYGSNYKTFRAAFPVNGKEVYENTVAGRMGRPLDTKRLHEMGWESA